MGCGSATPQKIINNDQLGQRVDTNDEWIQSRTGIGERRVIGEHESLIDLATDAALNAVEMANWDVKTIDLIIFQKQSGVFSHFGVFLENDEFLHHQEGLLSSKNIMNDEFYKKVHSIYRIANN